MINAGAVSRFGLSLLSAAALACLIAACGSSGGSTSAATPTAPSTPTLSSLAVACGAGTTTVQCSATARLSDLSTQTVTGQATASLTKAVIQFTLIGTVTDGTSHGVLPNINIEAADASGNLRTATTGGGGAYAIAAIDAGTYTLTASASGYQATSRAVTVAGHTQADVVLPRITTIPPGQPPASLTCSGIVVPAIVSCLNNLGNLAPTAQCNDGAFSCSTSKSGTCSGHSGVRCYVCPGPLC